MVTDRVRIDSLAAGREHLAHARLAPGAVLVVPVDRRVPTWLAELVDAAHAARASVVVEAQTPADLEGEAAAGWQIGVCTAALAAGADDVVGVEAQRVARVRDVTASLDAARAGGAPEVVP